MFKFKFNWRLKVSDMPVSLIKLSHPLLTQIYRCLVPAWTGQAGPLTFDRVEDAHGLQKRPCHCETCWSLNVNGVSTPSSLKFNWDIFMRYSIFTLYRCAPWPGFITVRRCHLLLACLEYPHPKPRLYVYSASTVIKDSGCFGLRATAVPACEVFCHGLVMRAWGAVTLCQ